MTQITRLFENPTQARAAFNELKERRFEQAELLLAPDPRTRPSSETLVEPLRRAGVEPSSAEQYAEQLKRGASVVTVRAPFGSAARATEILNRHSAAASQPAVSGRVGNGQNGVRSASDSNQARQPDGSRVSTTATSDVKSSGASAPSPRGPKTLSQMLGIPELINSNTFFSGFPLLIRSQPRGSQSEQEAKSPATKQQT